MKKTFLAFAILLAIFFLAACGETSQTPIPPDTVLVDPESDNGNEWGIWSSDVPVSTLVYRVTVRVNDSIVNHTETSAEGGAFIFGGYGSANYRMWQEGKGLLPVELISLEPSLTYIPTGSRIILKTTDLKAMALPDGAITTFICNLDTEVLSPVDINQELTEDRYTHELDDCRMVTPVFTPKAER